MQLMRWFIKKNQRLSYLIRRSLPSAWIGEDLKLVQDRLVPELVDHLPAPVVVDVGGGRNCYFARNLKPAKRRLIAVDIAPEELRLNSDVSHRVVADAVNGLPFPPESVDLVVTRSVMEHLRNTDAFLAEAGSCLRPGGHLVSVFPCRYSPFSALNRMIPNRIVRSILFYFHPYYKDDCGFEAFYDRMYYSKIMELLIKHNFEVKDVRVRYYQSMYYDFFVPLYLVSLAYDIVLHFSGTKSLAAQLSFVAQRKALPVDRGGPSDREAGGLTRSDLGGGRAAGRAGSG